MPSRRIAAAVAAATLATAGIALARDALRGNGERSTQRRELPGSFDAIRLEGSLDARVDVGPEPAIAVTIDSNLQERVRLRLDGSTLVVGLEDASPQVKDARVEISLPALRALETNGSADATIEGGRGNDLALSTNGSGTIRWKGEAGRLEVNTSGSGDAVLAGRAASVSIRTSGSADVDGRALVARDAEVRTSGSGDAEVTLEGGTLRAWTSGSGDVTYAGSAAVEAHESGSGEVRRAR